MSLMNSRITSSDWSKISFWKFSIPAILASISPFSSCHFFTPSPISAICSPISRVTAISSFSSATCFLNSFLIFKFSPETACVTIFCCSNSSESFETTVSNFSIILLSNFADCFIVRNFFSCMNFSLSLTVVRYVSSLRAMAFPQSFLPAVNRSTQKHFPKTVKRQTFSV